MKLANRRERRKRRGKQLLAVTRELNGALEAYLRGEDGPDDAAGGASEEVDA